MSCHRWCLALACLAVTLSLVPTTSAVPSGLLAELADKSICRSKVIVNTNEKRIPRFIKEVKCIASPDTMCPLGDGETSCCARNSHRNRVFTCEEVLDTVLVSYTDAEPGHETVSVGCSCVLHQVVTAEEV